VKKLIASACIAAGLLLPATPAGASEATAIVRVTDCPPGYTGYVVQAWNEKRGWYDVAAFCIPWGP
jgi:hypothetical protein